MAGDLVTVGATAAIQRPDLTYRGAGLVNTGPPTQVESVVSDATRSALVFHVPGSFVWMIPIEGTASLMTVTCELWRGPDVVVLPTISLAGPAGAKATTVMGATPSTWLTTQVSIPVVGSGLVCFTVTRPELLVSPLTDAGNMGGWVWQSLPVNGVLQDRTLRANNRRRVEVRFPTANVVVFS